jgi:hypothetical protein
VSNFTDHVSIEPFRDNGIWKWCLTAPLAWEVGKEGSGFMVTADAGFVTDLASIPRWARWLFNPYEPETAKAAVVHDNLLKLGWEQRAAAGEFYAALSADSVKLRKRIIYYLAVVLAIDHW